MVTHLLIDTNLHIQMYTYEYPQPHRQKIQNNIQF